MSNEIKRVILNRSGLSSNAAEGDIVHELYAEFPCERCGGSVSTAFAGQRTSILNGVRFSDVPCANGDAFYTVEVLER